MAYATPTEMKDRERRNNISAEERAARNYPVDPLYANYIRRKAVDGQASIVEIVSWNIEGWSKLADSDYAVY